MLSLPQLPPVDKPGLIGACARLPLGYDAARLQAEVAALPLPLWGGTGGRVGVHSAAQAIFLRGYAPAEGEKPIEDRPVLDSLPYARELIQDIVPAAPMRCLLAKLPAGGFIPVHIDRADYFAKTVRLHFPVVTHDQAWMYSDGRLYRMRAGEVWALNNSAPHGVLNAHPNLARLHMICDFLPSPALLDLLGKGRRDLDVQHADVRAYIVNRSAAGA